MSSSAAQEFALAIRNLQRQAAASPLTGRKPAVKRPKAWACQECCIAKRHCDGQMPCDRCAKFGLICRPHPKGRVHPLLQKAGGDGVQEDEGALTMRRALIHAKVEHYANEYWIVLLQLCQEGTIDYNRTAQQLRVWQGMAAAMGADVTHGLIDSVAELLRLHPGGLSLAPDNGLTMSKLQASHERNKLEAAAQVLRRSPEFMRADDGHTPMLMLVTVEHCNYLTTNEAYDATFLAAEAQIKTMMDTQTILELLSLSWINPTDRRAYLTSLLTLWLGVTTRKMTQLVRCLGRNGRGSLYLLQGRHVMMKQSGARALVLTFEDAPESMHIKRQHKRRKPSASTNGRAHNGRATKRAASTAAVAAAAAALATSPSPVTEEEPEGASGHLHLSSSNPFLSSGRTEEEEEQEQQEGGSHGSQCHEEEGQEGEEEQDCAWETSSCSSGGESMHSSSSSSSSSASSARSSPVDASSLFAAEPLGNLASVYPSSFLTDPPGVVPDPYRAGVSASSAISSHSSSSNTISNQSLSPSTMTASVTGAGSLSPRPVVASAAVAAASVSSRSPPSLSVSTGQGKAKDEASYYNNTDQYLYVAPPSPTAFLPNDSIDTKNTHSSTGSSSSSSHHVPGNTPMKAWCAMLKDDGDTVPFFNEAGLMDVFTE